MYHKPKITVKENTSFLSLVYAKKKFNGEEFCWALWIRPEEKIEELFELKIMLK